MPPTLLDLLVMALLPALLPWWLLHGGPPDGPVFADGATQLCEVWGLL